MPLGIPAGSSHHHRTRPGQGLGGRRGGRRSSVPRTTRRRTWCRPRSRSTRLRPRAPERPIPKSLVRRGRHWRFALGTVAMGIVAVSSASSYNNEANKGTDPTRADELRGRTQAFNVTTDVLLISGPSSAQRSRATSSSRDRKKSARRQRRRSGKRLVLMAAGLPETGEMLEGVPRRARGGRRRMGRGPEATNVRIKRRVAIKILRQQYARTPRWCSASSVRRWPRRNIESQHVVQIFDAGVPADGRPYMVSAEFLVGEDLGKRIDKAPRTASRSSSRSASRSRPRAVFAAAHQANIFHRDMKLSNIVIAKTKTGREVAKIVDFGIPKLLNDQEGMSNTQTGTIMGCPCTCRRSRRVARPNTENTARHLFARRRALRVRHRSHAIRGR